MSDPLIIPPRSYARGVVVLENDDPYSSIEYYHDVDGFTTAFLMGKNPSFLAWIPAMAYGEIRVYTEASKTAGEPKHRFDVQIHGCADLRTALSKQELQEISENSKDQVPAPGKWYNIECPEGSGRYGTKWCPNDKHAECKPDGELHCVAGGPGGG